MSRAKKREYKIYARARRMDFTTKSEAYSQGTHRWTYTVFATSIRQAYALAGQEIFAANETSVGVRLIESDWWHGDHTPESAVAAGLRIVAPYRQKKVT
jgi:hypothetical protein